MNIEYLDTDTDAGRLIRFYPANADSAARLIAIIEGMLLHPQSVVRLTELPDFQPVSGCELALSVEAKETGVIVDGSVPWFRWALSPRSWGDVVELLKPFALQKASHDGFQWLCGPNAIMISEGEVSVLISTYHDGGW